MRVIHHGDCLDVLRTMPDNSADGLLSDPPAGIGFMGKSWDRDKGGRDQWIAWLASVMREAHRVMKPGAYGLVWALPRTAHWTTIALEDAGFEVRDVVLHLFGSGFPKSLDVSKAIDAAAGAERAVVGTKRGTTSAETGKGMPGKATGVKQMGIDVAVTAPATDRAREWEGYGTALKPAAEHWILVRKKLDGTVAANVAKWGTGGIAIDACRIGDTKRVPGSPKLAGASAHTVSMPGFDGGSGHDPNVGRWPANVTLSEDAARELDDQAGDHPGMSGGGSHSADYAGGMFGSIDAPHLARNDTGGPSRFFYVAKTSTAERNFGCENLREKDIGERIGRNAENLGVNSPRAGAGRTGGARNHHPTIKSISLTKWLATLIKPPGDGKRLLCPFAGSGGEVIGAMRAGWEHIDGIEQDADFVEIARARIARWEEVPMHLEPDDVAPVKSDERQGALF